jgi:hypothetical protein
MKTDDDCFIHIDVALESIVQGAANASRAAAPMATRPGGNGHGGGGQYMGQYISCSRGTYQPMRDPGMKWYLSELELPDADNPEPEYGTGHGERPLGDGLGHGLWMLQQQPCSICHCSVCPCRQPGAARVPAAAPCHAHPCTCCTLAACRLRHFPGPGAQLRQPDGPLGHVPTPRARLVQVSLMHNPSA